MRSQFRSKFTTRVWRRLSQARPPSARERGSAAMTNDNAQRAPAPSADADQAALKLEEFLPYRLNVCANLVSEALSHVYGERYKIGLPDWRVLVTLGQFGMMTAKAIGIHSHMHKTKVSRAVALLERRKLVVRRARYLGLVHVAVDADRLGGH